MSKTKKIIAAVLFIALVAGALVAYTALKPKAVAGGKTIEVLVVHGDESEKTFTISTDAENLRAALDQEALIAGDGSGASFYVQTVDGETADESQMQWWCISKDGEMLMTGVEDTMIADGDHYEIVLKTGW